MIFQGFASDVIGEATDAIVEFSMMDKQITFTYEISEYPSYQWWCIYQGVMPSWQHLNSDKFHWDWIRTYDRQNQNGTITYRSQNFVRGAIYTLALFKDSFENAYELADYVQFRAC